jgi:hypothetical protein
MKIDYWQLITPEILKECFSLSKSLEEDYQDSQIDPDNFTHYSLTQYMPLLVSTFV